MSCIRAQARRCSQLLSMERCQVIANDLLALADKFEARQQLFTKLRVNFTMLASSVLQSDEEELLSEAPLNLLGTILITEVHKMLDGSVMDENWFALFETICTCPE